MKAISASKSRAMPLVSTATTGRRPFRWCAPVLVAAALVMPEHALAFRTGGDLPELASGAPVAWRSGEITFDLVEGLPRSMTAAAATQGLLSAYATWEATGCRVPTLAVGSTPTPRQAAPADGRSSIQWITTGWTDRRFSADAAAITDVQYAREDGGDWAIVEADIYLNAEHFSWGSGAEAGPAQDLASVATHELGHVLGLMHPCELDGSNGAPACTPGTAETESSLYPLHSVEQATLAEDDIAGACFLYAPREPLDAGAPSHDGGSPSRDGRCFEDDHCPPDEHCAATYCRPVTASVGDACSTDEECRSGVCADGFCGTACDAKDAGGEACADGAGFGAPCSASDDCRSEKCVAGTASGALCTRPCGAHVPPCPGGWDCREVEGEAVCAPVEVFAGGTGCSVGRPSGKCAAPEDATSTVPLAWLAAAGLGLAALRKKGKNRC